MTTTVALVGLALLGILVLLLLGAQIEMFRSLQQLREYSGLIDRPSQIELGKARGGRPSDYGLPATLDSAGSWVVLFLSDKCATCRVIASALAAGMPADLTAVIDAGGADSSSRELAVTYGLDPSRTVVDLNRQIMNRLDLNVTPVGVVVENGRLVRAVTVPSTRQLYTLMESTRTLRSPRDIPST
jgi:hypothetical protein